MTTQREEKNHFWGSETFKCFQGKNFVGDEMAGGEQTNKQTNKQTDRQTDKVEKKIPPTKTEFV